MVTPNSDWAVSNPLKAMATMLYISNTVVIQRMEMERL